MRKIFLFTFLLTAAAALAQQPDPLLLQKKIFADANAINLMKSHQYDIKVKDGKLVAVCNIHEQIYIAKEAGIAYKKGSVPTDKFVEALNIKAATLVPKNKKFSRVEVGQIELKASLGSYSFYDDSKTYTWVYPNIQVGSILDVSYQMNYIEPRFLGNFYFEDFIPTIDQDLSVTTGKDVHIAYKYLNCDESMLQFTKEEKKGEIVYHWKLKESPGITQYSDALDYRYYVPHVIFYITGYDVGGKTVPYLGTPRDLYSWYSSLQKNVNKTEDARLKQITDSLCAGIKTDDEKISRIFYWVQDNISYVAFEDGLGGFIPRDASVVCSRKFGDCKDMASIIVEMFRIAGLNAYPTWIGTRDIPYKYEDIPTPFVDNHMIAAYKKTDGTWMFLDGTGKNAPDDLYTSMIQGKQALIGISPDSFALVTVPVVDTSINQTSDTVYATIANNIVEGKGRVTLVGYDRLDFIYRTGNLSTEEFNDFFKSYFSKGNNKITFHDIERSEQGREALKFKYQFDLPAYVRSNGNEMYFNMNMDDGLSLEQYPADRVVPSSFKHRTLKKLTVILDLPEGYVQDYLPADVAYGNEIAGFRSSYRISGNKIIHSDVFYINTLNIYPQDFPKYNKVLTEMVKSQKQVVSFIKK